MVCGIIFWLRDFDGPLPGIGFKIASAISDPYFPGSAGTYPMKSGCETITEHFNRHERRIFTYRRK